ncbi:MAG: NYN domain-containing protein [Chloroflexi bacterium]|nr:NYN domain-containing protein [Chloroflexota bacterium]
MQKCLPDQRVALLVDVQNIYYAAKKFGQENDLYAYPNFRFLIEQFRERKLVRAIAYIIEIDQADQRDFNAVLREMGFEVKVKRPKSLPNGRSKADWDIGITMDAVALRDRVDVVVLVTGDSDYVPLIHWLQACGVKIEILGFQGTIAAELFAAADECTALECSTETLILRPNPTIQASTAFIQITEESLTA